MKVICISFFFFFLLLTVVLCITPGAHQELRLTLKPNGKLSDNFVWLDMGLPNTEKESNTLNASLFTKFGSLLCGYLYSLPRQRGLGLNFGFLSFFPSFCRKSPSGLYSVGVKSQDTQHPLRVRWVMFRSSRRWKFTAPIPWFADDDIR